MSSLQPLIAIVDDEESIRKALGRLLRAMGYRVAAYPSGGEFLDSLNAGRPDCVVLDLHMPEMSGFAIQTALTALEGDIPVVVITGHDAPETRERALQGGASAYLRKPVDEKLLLKALSDATGRR